MPLVSPISSASNPGGLADGADLDGHAFVFGLLAGLTVLVEALTLDVDDDGVTGGRDAVFDRFEARGAIAQLFERLIDGRVFDRDG